MKHSILLVDDDETDRYLFKRLIKSTQLDVEIIEKSNGREALEFFQNQQCNTPQKTPCLCFLDINMPVMSGWEFLTSFTELRSAEEQQPMPIIMLSSSSDATDLQRAESLELVTDYIGKSEITAEHIVQAMQSLLRHND